MHLVDGRAIAEAIKADVRAEIATREKPPTLAVISCDPNFETQKYLELKKSIATSLGITLEVNILPKATSQSAMLAAVEEAVSGYDGVIVQLPLPATVDTDAVLAGIPKEKDVDAFSYKGEMGGVLPPVVGAIAAIGANYQLTWAGKQVVIFGSGRLVGIPAAYFARSKGAMVSVVTAETAQEEVSRLAKSADIIILGAGKPGLLKPDMISDGVSIFDAGASEDGGILTGDADPAVADKAGLLTPVPGGIGPVTVAVLFKNLLELCRPR